MTDDPTFSRAAAAGVMTTSYAVAVIGRGHLRAQLAARRWQRPYRGVIVMHNGPLTHDQVLWLTLLACPPRTVLGGLTAAALDGLEGFPQAGVFVQLPKGGRRPRLDGLVTSWSTHLGTDQVHPARTPPRTRITRSLIDGASSQQAPARARAIILAGVQQRLVVAESLEAALATRGACRHRGLIMESIMDAAGGLQSLPEWEFDLIRRRRRLPVPDRQRALRRQDGRMYLDNVWASYDVSAEVHGIPHLRVSRWEADLERQNEIIILGPRLICFSSYAIRHEADRVGDQLERALRRGGWAGR
jgi:hypothetical protein